MRLWHEQLIPYLDRQHLLGQHRECCALRGAGWGRPHSVVNYVFNYKPDYLFAYHCLIMTEMEARGYKPDPAWKDPQWRGQTLGTDTWIAKPDNSNSGEVLWVYIIMSNALTHEPIYKEHNRKYLRECIDLLKAKNAPMDFDKIESELKIK